MALEEFEPEELNERQKGYVRMRSIMDVGMGVLWSAMGVFLFFVKEISPQLAMRYDDIWMKIFGGICLVYGAFRIYRGLKKDYYRER